MAFKNFLLQPLAAAALICVSVSSQAALTAYTSSAAFLAALSSSATDTFNDLPAGEATTSLNRNAGAFSYSVKDEYVTGASSSFYVVGSAADRWLSSNASDDVVTVYGFSSGVSAIGGNFFATDFDGVLLSGKTISLTATDASGSLTQTIVNGNASSFLGFVSSQPLTSLVVTAVQDTGAVWPTINNLTLGVAAVPEPQTYALMLAGLGIVGLMARRRRF